MYQRKLNFIGVIAGMSMDNEPLVLPLLRFFDYM